MNPDSFSHSSYPVKLPGAFLFSRSSLFQLVNAALETQQIGFARELIDSWLTSYPGDLKANLVSARIFILEGRLGRAIPLLVKITESDPQNTEAWKMLHHCYRINQRQEQQTNHLASIRTMVFGLTGEQLEAGAIAPWGLNLYAALHARTPAEVSTGLVDIPQLIIENQHAPILGIAHLSLLDQRNLPQLENNLQLLENYHQTWPGTLVFTLRLAAALMAWGDHPRAITLLNQAVASDVAAEVAQNLWGIQFPYRSLWPERLEIQLARQIPAATSAFLGWNHLPAGIPGNTDLPVAASEEHESAPALETEVAKEGPQADTNHRQPVYVVFSVRQALHSLFGAQGFADVDHEMDDLVACYNRFPGWKALKLYADDPAGFSHPLTSAKAGDAWSLKLFLGDLEKALNQDNCRIGAVLIVGGPQVVPFHALPNPVNDPDEEVLSDNPYASLDENYYIPDWPVGRIPDGAPKTNGGNPSPQFLLQCLKDISGRCIRYDLLPWYQRLLPGIKTAFSRNSRSTFSSNIGCAAEVWESVSSAVFNPIGRLKNLWISPPYGFEEKQKTEKGWKRFFHPTRSKSPATLRLPPGIKGNLAYFNLHGLADAPEWYGQKDPQRVNAFPDYPVALRPQDLPRPGSQHFPQVAFSEACYGAFIPGKNPDQAISLSFLRSGSLALVGSTCMAYGSVSTPLIGADLLANNFWILIKEGFPVGEALQRAKINLVQVMNARQGYLDGEDQKTLISFVLYGDPLGQPLTQTRKAKLPWRPPLVLKEVKTISDTASSEAISQETLVNVKKIVNRYLPGMVDAKMMLFEGEVTRYGKILAVHTVKPTETNQRITVSKQFTIQERTHKLVAHLTLNPKGKLLKLSISR